MGKEREKQRDALLTTVNVLPFQLSLCSQTDKKCRYGEKPCVKESCRCKMEQQRGGGAVPLFPQRSSGALDGAVDGGITVLPSPLLLLALCFQRLCQLPLLLNGLMGRK